MPSQTKAEHKRPRGRPRGKRYAENVPARLEPGTVVRIEAWAEANDVSRSEAIRRLVEKGLGDFRAAKPAGAAIDAAGNVQASARQRARRKGNLMKRSPEEDQTRQETGRREGANQ